MERSKKTSFDFYMLPLVLAVAVVPLLTMMTSYSSGIGKYTWASGGSFVDFFLGFKRGALILLGAVIIILFCAAQWVRAQAKAVWTTKKQKIVLFLLAVFWGVTAISALLADEKMDALFGGFEQMEGLLVVTAYVALFCLAYFLLSSENKIQVIVHALLIGSLILSVLGALQAFGVDYLANDVTTPFFTMFMHTLPKKFNGITASFGKGVSYATLYNPNYVGSYVALVLPLTIYEAVQDEKNRYKIVAAASAVCQLIMLKGSGSLAGMVGVGAAVCVAVLFLFSDIHKNRKILCGVFVVAVGLVALFLWKNPTFFRSVIKGNGEPCSSHISSMISDGTSVKITLHSGKMITLRWDADATVYEFEALNENGKKIEMTGDSFSGVKLKGDAYQGLLFEATKRQITYQEQKTYFDVLRLTVDDKYSWDFAMLGVGLRYINGVGKPDMLHYVESFGMEGHYDFASNRGYIWSRTFPLLKRALLLGVGQDNFAYAFPNDDYVGKVNCGFNEQIVTKPHNMYLQIWVQDGLPALLAFLALYLLLFGRTIRKCFKKGKWNHSQKISLAFLCGVSGYFVAGLKLQWNIGALYTRGNDIRKIKADAQKIELTRQSFLLNSSIEAEQKNNAIEKARDVLDRDSEIISLRQRIRASGENQYREGTIKMNDYLSMLDEEYKAKANESLHEVQLMMAVYDMKNTIGK